MKISVLALLASGACASIALAEPLPPAAATVKDPTAQSPGPIALTETELDNVSAGADRARFYEVILATGPFKAGGMSFRTGLLRSLK